MQQGGGLEDPEEDFVQYVSVETRDGPRSVEELEGALTEGAAAAPPPAEERPPLSRVQWLTEVQFGRQSSGRLLGSSDRRDLEHAWLGLDEHAAGSLPFLHNHHSPQPSRPTGGGALSAAAFRVNPTVPVDGPVVRQSFYD